MSAYGSKRLVAAAIRYAILRGRSSVTLVHKGNIMKFTEWAFAEWGNEVAAEEFPEETIREGGEGGAGKIVIKDRIAYAIFQQLLFRPAEISVLAAPILH